MVKGGHNNPAFVNDVQRMPKKYSLELVEKANKYDAVSKEIENNYNPYDHREVEHPTT